MATEADESPTAIDPIGDRVPVQMKKGKFRIMLLGGFTCVTDFYTHAEIDGRPAITFRHTLDGKKATLTVPLSALIYIAEY